ncbi:MAG: hypothetical protein KF897_08925 [Opitutaceae bacterium]|nr:hypothetical protein [Opitutaceae bacterium]
MKTITILISFLLAVAAASAAETTVAGPKGGRMLIAHPVRAEFFVTTERRVELSFFDEAGKTVSPGTTAVTVTAETTGGRVAVPLVSQDATLVSVEPLPPGDPYRVVVQVRSAPGARPSNFRIELNLHECGECQRAEYACTCASH